MEAASVTGPAKNLIGFCRWLRTAEGQQTGLRIAIATFDRNARACESDGFAGTARAAGIETHVIRERHRFDLGVIPQLRALAASLKPDIIQTHNNKSHLLVTIVPELRSQRVWFAFQHGDVYTDLKQRLYNQVDRLTLPSADRVVSVCHAFTPRLIGYGVRPERIRILHNAATPATPTATAERAQLREQLGVSIDERIILTIARLSKEKGHADLLQALALLHSRAKALKLILVGIGPEKGNLERIAHSLGISERVVFAGFFPNVSRFFSISDLLVLPSHTEGSSNVLLEAMTAKVPIVATTAGGNPEIIVNERTGLLVPVADPHNLASAIARLLDDPDLASRFADTAAVKASEEFSVERYRRQLSGYYAEALGGQSKVSSYSAASGDAN